MSRTIPLYDAIVRRQPGRYDCPLHQSKSGSPVRVSINNSTVLIRDWGGCNTGDILKALGLPWAVLFPEPITTDPTERRRQEQQALARQGLELWRQRQLSICCVLLREIETLISDTTAILNVIETMIAETDNPHAKTAWDVLQAAYQQKSLLEFDFERLNSKDESLHREVWRERRNARAA